MLSFAPAMQVSEARGRPRRLVSNGRPWSAKEYRALRRDYREVPVDAIASRLGRTVESIRGAAQLLGISRKLIFPTRVWTRAEIAVLRTMYPDRDAQPIAAALNRSIGSVYQRAKLLGLKKSEDYLARILPARHQKLCAAGAGHRFHKGLVPWNTGRRMPTTGRMAETQFKKGQKPHTWVPIGSQRNNKDGILQRKVTDTGNAPHDWRSVHSLIWEETNGPVPPGHIVVFKDRDRRNFAPDNLELITRAECMRRNSYHTNYPKEIGLLIQAHGALNRKIRRVQRNEEQG